MICAYFIVVIISSSRVEWKSYKTYQENIEWLISIFLKKNQSNKPWIIQTQILNSLSQKNQWKRFYILNAVQQCKLISQFTLKIIVPMFILCND